MAGDALSEMPASWAIRASLVFGGGRRVPHGDVFLGEPLLLCSRCRDGPDGPLQ